MNARKLIVMDLDGTLLNEEGIVTQKKKIFRKVKERGICNSNSNRKNTKIGTYCNRWSRICKLYSSRCWSGSI